MKLLRCAWLLLLFPLFWGCAPVEIRLDYLQDGFDYTNMGYNTLPKSLPLNEKIELNNVKVHIVGSLEAYEKNRFREDEVGMNMDPQRKREIWVLGKELKGKIIINQLVLGHELKHLIHLKQPDVINPCKLEDFEACIAIRSPLDCK
jgi:hypothetical protein